MRKGVVAGIKYLSEGVESFRIKYNRKKGLNVVHAIFHAGSSVHLYILRFRINCIVRYNAIRAPVQH